MEGRSLLAAASESPFLDAVLLLGHVLALPREKVLAGYPEPLPPTAASRFLELVSARAGGDQIAYLTGHREFRGLDFLVTRDVLIPRPDTETLVDAAREWQETCRFKSLHDLCTGSGCIAVALKHELPACRVTASDISPEAVGIAEKNRDRLLPPETELPVFESDLLESVAAGVEMIVSNPPYLTGAEMAQKSAEAWPEPFLALDGGADGLDLIRKVIPQAELRLKQGGALLLEAGSEQSAPIEELFRRRGWKNVTVWADLAGRHRVTGARWYS